MGPMRVNERRQFALGVRYDSLGQVTSGKRAWADGSRVAGQQFDYSFDDIGNRRIDEHQPIRIRPQRPS
jgi:hypothetical protein